MKNTWNLLFVSIAAGATTLLGYKYLIENPDKQLQNNATKTTVTENFKTAPNIQYVSNGLSSDVNFVNAAKKTTNAVVHVKNIATQSSRVTSIFDLLNQRQGAPTQIGTGSGVIISADGYIVTNNHVIANATALEVTLNNNKTYSATLVGADPETDIALLKIEDKNPFEYLRFGDSDMAQIGEWVLAVGNPFNLTSTVTAGIISAKSRDLNPNDAKNQSFIQTDAAVNPGNSGGALVNTNADLIGINTAISSQTGSYIGYAFAVPSNIAKRVVEDLMLYGNVQKGIIGIGARGLNDLTPKGYEQLEIDPDQTQGVYVLSIEPDSGADKAGLQKGDIITQIDHIKINKWADLTGYVKSKRIGEQVNITFLRDKKQKAAEVVIAKNPIYNADILRLQLKNINQKEAKIFGIKQGVKIANVLTRELAPLKENVLLEINNQPIANIEQAQQVLESIGTDQSISILLLDKNRQKERIIYR